MKVLRIQYSEDRIDDAKKLADLFDEKRIVPLMEPQKDQRPERMTNYLKVKKIK